MLDIPSRDGLAALRRAVNEITPAAILCLTRRLDESRLQVLYADSFGIGSFTEPALGIPPPLWPEAAGVQSADSSAFDQESAIGWQVSFDGVHRVWSMPVPEVAAGTRLWVGRSDERALTRDEAERLTEVAGRAAGLLRVVRTDAEQAERLRRLDLTAELLPALMPVLDLREVFDPLSEISKRAVPHDLLAIALYNDELTHLTAYAGTANAPEAAGVYRQPYPPAVVRRWDFDIADDRFDHPLERDRPPTRQGCQSSIRVRMKLGDRVIGGLAFMSFERSKYTSDDLEVARRLADYVAVALSHQRLAEQARQHEGLRARAANLELLDDLLASSAVSGDLKHVFERVAAIARKVLPHDALSLPIRLPDGTQARVLASVGFDPPLPEIIDVPGNLIHNPEWEHELVDHLSARTESHHVRAARRGFESLLRVPVRLEGRFAGALVFWSKQAGAFTPPDVLVARRMADRLALVVSRDREVEASNRADEASARASRLEARVRALTEELDVRTGFRRVIGDSAEWRQVLTQATQVAPNDTTVLLLGESGTGKEVVARFVHRASKRAGGPFVALNCAALPEQLLEAELFGYERGAFTGAVQNKPGQLEQAAGGTLFLDEIGEMSLPAQAKFLRVLQEREFQRLGGTRVLRTDARIVAATNRDLERAITQNQFREDLYYRLNVFSILLPPLRERRLDVLPLSEAFLAEIGRSMGRPPAGMSRDARDLLLDYHWPGNVRELRNILERASILCDGGLITPEHLPIKVSSRPTLDTMVRVPASVRHLTDGAERSPKSAPPSPAAELKSIEREMIEQALQRVRFNKSKAARDLGLSRQQLYVRMKKYGLE